MDQNKLDLLRLHLTPGVGRTALFHLHQTFGSFSNCLAAGVSALRGRGRLSSHQTNILLNPDDKIFRHSRRRLEDLQVRLMSFWDPDYPQLLREIHDPPALLYVRGRLPENEVMAIVGSRRASPAGLQLTRDIAAALSGHGITIASGLARGIDTAAHLGALEAQGGTIAVLGCGIDRVYPPENAALFQRILENNAVISEFPPGTPPLAGHFPGRNRIISGLSRGVLVVEAAAGSGSLITSEFALEQGRDVFAVPGSVTQSTSSGPNQLLKEGAQIVTEARDILEVLWPAQAHPRPLQTLEDDCKGLSGKHLKLYLQLSGEPEHIDDIGRKCGLTPMEVSAILLDLELQDKIQALPGKHFIRRRLPQVSAGGT